MKIELEFKRIQTYLFASPRLRAMLGANSILGETIRIKLARLARDTGAVADSDLLKQLPHQNPDDPLAKVSVSSSSDLLCDDPALIYRDYGVLVRDGGHFIATFPDRAKAEAFVQQAYSLIAENLPGILVEARIDGESIQPDERSESLFQHPAFQVSHQNGHQPAQERGVKGTFTSAEEATMEDRGRSFRQHPTDIIALLENSGLIPGVDKSIQSFAEIAQGGYIALIHADGNSIGKRYQEWQKRGPADGLAREAHGERFFHKMRVSVRCALVKALTEVFPRDRAPYRLLMLGGDDLLMVCAAGFALPFVRSYAKELAKIPLADGEPLSIGAGVAIAKDSFPIHRLHEIAESLADSSKRLYRARPECGSVVDWSISTNAWVEDPLSERRAESLRGKTILSRKPYPVLGDGSLHALLEEISRLAQIGDLARSQLRTLVEVQRQGDSLARLAWQELPKTTREPVERTLKQLGQTGILEPLNEDYVASFLADIVELLEIMRKQGQYSC